MTDISRLVAVVLAAGGSQRFGGDKLLHPLGGKPLAAHIAATLATLPFMRRVAICPAGSSQRRALFEGFEIIENADPGRGMASSLALGAQRAVDLRADAMLVCLADMPYVTAEHILLLIAAIAGDGAVATEVNGTRSPPAIFTRALLPKLVELSGDQGARHLLKDAAVVAAPAELVKDFDTRADFG